MANYSHHLKVIVGADSFGCDLKDALVSHLRALEIDVEDLGTDSYHSVAAKVGRRVSASAIDGSRSIETRGLVACGTGVGVAIFANKFPGVFASTCLTPGDADNTRSINNCNVIAVSGMSTSPELAIEIVDKWLHTPFKAPCPASGSKPWPSDIELFLDKSVSEMAKIGTPAGKEGSVSSCAICRLAAKREFEPLEMMPGGSIKIVRETPTSAVGRFKAGGVEPAHHHTFGHDSVVMKGSTRVWNLSKRECYDLGVGDYLFTPAGDVHRVEYFENSEFFITFDGKWDIFLDEDLSAAMVAVEKQSA